jgi:Cu/Ag efflux protein CusF
MPRILPVLAAALALSFGCTQSPARQEPAAAPKTETPAPNATPAAPAKGAHVFNGKVEKIDVANKRLTVNGENVEGWMSAMTMDYTPDNPSVLDTVKVGDQITAQVFDGDFSTLHDVKVVAPAKP